MSALAITCGIFCHIIVALQMDEAPRSWRGGMIGLVCLFGVIFFWVSFIQWVLE